MKKIMFNDRYGLTQAVLKGRKTMTRRIIKDKNGLYADIRCMQFSHLNDKGQAVMRSAIGFATLQPAYHPGEVVAVAQNLRDMGYNPRDTKHRSGAIWGLDHTPAWSNKMFVSASECKHRIRITKVRVERLQDISNEDALREGVYKRTEPHPRQEWKPEYTFGDGRYHAKTPRAAFAALIDEVSSNGTWESNPWVFVYEFELVK